MSALAAQITPIDINPTSNIVTKHVLPVEVINCIINQSIKLVPR